MKTKLYKKTTDSKTRLKYLYDNFAKNEKISLTDFLDEVNKSYYKFDDYLFPWDLRDIYVDFFKNVEDGYDIIDIGAGSGFSHNLISQIGYRFINKYYFIEPSTNMSDRFKNDRDNNTVIINDYIENLWMEIKENKNKKIFIMNAALHHITDLDLFSKNLADVMGADDFLFIPHEPNNEFHSSFYFKFLKLSNPKQIIKTLAQTILGENQLKLLKGSFKKPSRNVGNNIERDTLDLALQDLLLKDIVTLGFKKEMIYAITDYGVANNWRNIYIPEEWNEGFYTLDSLPSLLNLRVEYQKTYSYNYYKDYPLFKKEQKFDKFFRSIFPRSGSILCLALKK